ncbi:MAG: 30S ribosomal protein S13 [Candidatus Niyogibacteria bacterium]|nr:30S ribosomal protein S13 [Candidatus Niyogibacteria bacterium]
MMRIAGTEIPNEKKLSIALTYIYGIGRTKAVKILEQAGISADKKAAQLSGDDTNKLRALIENDPLVDGSLQRTTVLNIKRLKDIGSYRGARHARSLPVRGQRTKTNSRTRRGNVRKTMGSGKRKEEKK